MIYVIYALIAVLVLQEAAFWFERRKLLNRIMAKDYEQFEYYDKKFKKDIQEVERLRDEAREERQIDDNTFEEDEVKLDLKDYKELVEGLEEDWKGDLAPFQAKKEEE